MLIGRGQVMRSPDGITWTVSDEPCVQGLDGAGRDDTWRTGASSRPGTPAMPFSPSGSAMATWTGTVCARTVAHGYGRPLIPGLLCVWTTGVSPR